jgi:hypothetical protein
MIFYFYLILLLIILDYEKEEMLKNTPFLSIFFILHFLKKYQEILNCKLKKNQIAENDKNLEL